MAVTAQLTREEIRVAVGHNLGAVYEATMTANGSTTTGVDSTLPNADNHINGNWVWFTSGTNDGAARIVDDYVGSTTTWTIRGDAITSTVDGDTYELWDKDLPPQRVHNFINRAVTAITRKGAPSTTNLSLHTWAEVRSYTVPTAVVGIESVEYRSWYTYRLLENCDSVWSESVDTDVTATADTEDKREGGASNKFVIAAGLAAGDIIATNAISSVNLSKYDYVEFSIKSTVATAAGDLQLLLDNTASCASPLESLDIPALAADTWTFVRLALANPETDTAIISVGLKDVSDIGAATIHLDAIEAVVNDSAVWEPIHWNFWRIDSDQRQIVFTPEGLPTYSLLKLIGRKKPTELTADASVCDIEPEYVIEKATSYGLRARLPQAQGEARIALRESLALSEALAADAIAKSTTPAATRWIDD